MPRNLIPGGMGVIPISLHAKPHPNPSPEGEGLDLCMINNSFYLDVFLIGQ
jgi:hypothetical protein